MSITCAGTVIGGTLHLDQKLAFADHTVVDVTISNRTADDLEKNHAQWRAFLQELKKIKLRHPIGSEGRRLIRDELYDRR